MVVKILGAGISGLTAAITLARAGQQVEVYERRQAVGKRFLGDLQGLENWSEERDVLENLTEMGLRVNFDCDPFHELTITDGQELQKRTFKRPLFYLVKRGAFEGSLDWGLRRQAEEAGVKIRYGTKLSAERVDIVATGPQRSEVCAVDSGLVFKTEASDMAVGMICNEAALKGYAYLLVTKGYGCICTVLFEQFGRLKECLETARQLFAKLVPIEMHEVRTVGGVGGFSLTRRFQRGKQLFVGEAAGLQDFLWGFGMRLAMRSGYLAARCLLNGENYVQAAEKAFWGSQRAGVVNRFFWERLIANGYPKMAQTLLKGDSPFGILRSNYRGNLLQKLLFPFLGGFMKQHYPQALGERLPAAPAIVQP